MSNYPFITTIIIPADKVGEVNDYLERQGYGPNNVVKSTLGERSSISAVATSYVLTMRADPGLYAALKQIVKKLKGKERVRDFKSEIVVSTKRKIRNIRKQETDLLKRRGLKIRKIKDIKPIKTIKPK